MSVSLDVTRFEFPDTQVWPEYPLPEGLDYRDYVSYANLHVTNTGDRTLYLIGDDPPTGFGPNTFWHTAHGGHIGGVHKVLEPGESKLTQWGFAPQRPGIHSQTVALVFAYEVGVFGEAIGPEFRAEVELRGRGVSKKSKAKGKKKTR